MEVIGKGVFRKESLENQLKEVAACVLRAPKEDLEIAGSRVFFRDDPSIGLHFKDIAYGYKYPNGNALSLAAGVSLHNLPLTPELIWKAKEAN
ncbi:hypothetical protein BACCIP111895_00130 [Neobacillus rhizosphaerae]|uniref:Uncharacterized protein n=1 Tax=Neobacillus rhizosphaerae TaxID=2880965 RepID=A0ABN8KIZ8_9BACI|nr:hypothetical protein [Neobacillus rhizosphaerae]CAH2712997.1 hypothetical protein BACCIP111895_00130 [Neobacillus rhizosphaerae]